jgi:pyridinium-3,5-biscarboxylic acid mononucleotide synthase
MDRDRLRGLLEEVASGRLTPQAGAERMETLLSDPLAFAQIDHHRAIRTGLPEVVFGGGKTLEQLELLIERYRARGEPVLLTRIDARRYDALRSRCPGAASWHYDPSAQLLKTGQPPMVEVRGVVAVVSAGTSDMPIALEAAGTLTFFGHPVELHYDVGIAGLHRVLAIRDKLEAAEVVIVVAGMEGALPGVVNGLISRPVIGVPTTKGPEVVNPGQAALTGMLHSCTAGLLVVNIDNGFGAACAAASINRLWPKR